MELSLSDVKGIAKGRYNRLKTKANIVIVLWFMFACLIICCGFTIAWVESSKEIITEYKIDNLGTLSISHNGIPMLNNKLLTPETVNSTNYDLLLPALIFGVGFIILFLYFIATDIDNRAKYISDFLEQWVKTKELPEIK